MRPRLCYLITLLLGFATLSAADSEPAAQAAAPQAEQARATRPKTQTTSRQKCIARCETDNGRCNSEVRQERQQCARKAASNGNDPLTGRPDDSFCDYFDADHCGYYTNRNACSHRFALRYAECVAWIRGSITSQRFDCMRAEAQAQNLCRDELKDCKEAC